MEKMIHINTIEETLQLGELIGGLLEEGMMITLNGDLGAGKTTFTKGIGKALGVSRIINSPTFTILKQYSGRYQLSHFDAYRLEGESDDLGFEEIFESEDICVVEWPEFIEDILPKERLDITIRVLGPTQRQYYLKPTGNQYEELVKEICDAFNCHG